MNIIKIGNYELTFPNSLEVFVEKYLYTTLQSAAQSYISTETKSEDLYAISGTYTKEELQEIVMKYLQTEFDLVGVTYGNS